MVNGCARTISIDWAKGLKKEAYNTGYSQAVTHPSTNPALQGLTSVIGREPVLSLWYGRRRESCAQINVVMGPSCCRVAEREEVEGYTLLGATRVGFGAFRASLSAFWRSSSDLMAHDKGPVFPRCVGSSFLSPLFVGVGWEGIDSFPSFGLLAGKNQRVV